MDTRLKSVSKDVFGIDYMLPVAVAILSSAEPMSLTQLTSQVGVSSSSSIQGALARLVAGGFVHRDADGGSDRARPYHRVDGAFWSLVQELYGRTSGPGLF